MRRRAAFAITATASQGIGLFAVAWVATQRLTQAELGFFFSFLSFGALIQLADFGLSYAALQTAGRLAGTGRLDELYAVGQRIKFWNAYAAGLSTVLVAAAGWWTFAAGGDDSVSNWTSAWSLYLIGSFLFQLSLPAIALREGAGRVVEAWRLRAIQEWVATAACLAVLFSGGRLWCLPAAALSRAAVAGLWLTFWAPLRASDTSDHYPMQRWFSESWPFQWKIGVSALSGFLIFRAIPPIILLEKGPVVAGQFGLTVSLMNLIITITSAWPMSQAAHYSTTVARGGVADLHREFPRLLWRSTLLAAAAVVSALAALWAARHIGLTFALRLTDPQTTAIILAACIAHHIVSCFAMFLRAEGREPLLIPSVAGGIATVATIWLTAHFGSVRDVAIANLVLAAGGIPIAVLLLRGRRRLITDAAVPPEHDLSGSS